MPHHTVEERCSLAIDHGTFGVWDLDPCMETVHYSPGWKARLGFPRIGASDSTWFWRCRVHPDDFDAMARSLRAHLEGDCGSYEARFRLRVNGSGYRTVLSRGRVVARNHHGVATRMVGTMIDLTDRPAAAAAGHGLAVEGPAPAIAAAGLPFHAVLGAVCAVRRSTENEQLIDRVGDLLERALHDTAPARLRHGR